MNYREKSELRHVVREELRLALTDEAFDLAEVDRLERELRELGDECDVRLCHEWARRENHRVWLEAHRLRYFDEPFCYCAWCVQKRDEEIPF